MDNLTQVPTIDDYRKTAACPQRQTGGCRLAVKRESEPGLPLVTVFTIVRNQKETLSQTIMSVLNQSYPNIEYIIVDGASTDSTLEVIKQFDDKIDLWISEPDQGTSDATNKGISLARGDFIFWPLAADDWIEPDFIEIAVKALLKTGADFVFGNMAMYANDKLISLVKGDKDYLESLIRGNPCFNFPSMIISKKCFQRFGLFNIAYKYSNDYEWFLRCYQGGVKGQYENLLTVHRRTGGFGERHLLQSTLEQLRILGKHRLPINKALFVYLNCFMRRCLGNLAKLLLPGIIHKELKRVVHRRRE